MPLLPLDLSPGVFKNGTEYGGRGRWADSNLVRWWDNSIQVIGGWERRRDSAGVNIPALISTPTTEAPRNIIAWLDGNGTRRMVIGTNSGLYSVSATGLVTDITPVGFVGGSRTSSLVQGYSTGRYGESSYGTPRLTDGLVPLPVASWSFALWGDVLLCHMRGAGPVYSWTPETPIAIEETAVPDDLAGSVVTAERIFLAVQDRTILWSDSEDYTNWISAANTQSGSVTVGGTSAFVTVKTLFDQHVCISDTAVHVARYIGPPFVFNITKVADQIDILGANSAVTTDGFLMWPGKRHFWLYDGAKVNQVQSPLQDFFFRDLAAAGATKVYAFTNKAYQEVWWLYQSNDSTTDENDSYICFNYANNTWTKGKIDRSIGEDTGVLRNPVMVSPSGVLYNHELEGVVLEDGYMPFCETGPLEIGQGDNIAFADYLYPDIQDCNFTTMRITVKAKDMPMTEARTYGPYFITSPTPVRLAGRQIAFRFEGCRRQWRIGSMRVNLKQGGRK